MWDNSDTLISYIHHSFITCDDTGVCEAVLRLPVTNGEKPGAIRVFHDSQHNSAGQSSKKFAHALDEEDVNDGSSTSEHSPDIHVDAGHRRRSETSRRLETLKLQRLAQSKIVTVQWKEPVASTSTSNGFENGPCRRLSENNNCNNNIIAEFTRLAEKEIKTSSTSRHRSSAVSKLIRANPNLPLNPFQEYMKFDGNTSVNCNAKTVRVFALMASKLSNRMKPLEVCVAGTAKVLDLIGLICFHYTSKNLTPQLSTDISRYELYVAEDGGEVDSDLPPRSPHENVSRFHFPYLALLDKGATAASSASASCNATNGISTDSGKKHVVMVHFSTGDKFKLELDTLDVPLRTIRDSALAIRLAKNDRLKTNVEYNIEKLNEPNSPLPLDATVSSAGTTEFVLVRAHSARGELTPGTPTAALSDHLQTPNVLHPMSSPPGAAGSSHYYTVTMVRKFKRDTRVQLVISNDRLEITPILGEERKLSTNSAIKLFRVFHRPHSGGTNDANASCGGGHSSKTVEFGIHRIGGAELLEEKAGRRLFRIVHKHHSTGTSNDWKSHQFETDFATAEEIVRTLNRYLDAASHGEVRQEFLRRTPRKSSFFKRLQQGDLSFSDASSGITPQN